ncbi:MAG TPA: hypothetical protein VN902_00395 [Candidatus Acidoferrales bacterium]|jgi:hypothetical protein|nr:hypothetical protein [Candidatus Acidoferrales bacterium]
MKIEKQKPHLSLRRKVLLIFRYDRNGKCIDDCDLRDPRAVLPDVLNKLIKDRINADCDRFTYPPQKLAMQYSLA